LFDGDDTGVCADDDAAAIAKIVAIQRERAPFRRA
jgi:hypothetical protein